MDGLRCTLTPARLSPSLSLSPSLAPSLLILLLPSTHPLIHPSPGPQNQVAHSVGCTADPEVQEEALEKGRHEFLVIASDGVWDVFSNNDACDVLRRSIKKPQEAANNLCNLSVERWGEKHQADNVGIVVLRFK